jgi:nickel-dependent lactate racemase
MPGLAHHESIDNNHFYLTHPDTRIGRLRGNPVSDDAAEFAAKLPMHFIIYSVSGPDDEVAAVVAGHPVKAHLKGCELGRRIYEVKAKRADIVVTSPGGAPYDCDLVQGKKGIIPAVDAVRRNGVVIICAECPQGLGAERTFTEWLGGKTPVEVTRDVLVRANFNLGAHGANILARPTVQKNAAVFLVTSPSVARELRGSYVRAFTKLSDAWKAANLIAGAEAGVLFVEKARRLILK